MNHSPTPWRAAELPLFDSIIRDTSGRAIATQMNPSDAAHIARCVNAHDELVAALEAIRAEWHNPNGSSDEVLDQLIAVDGVAALAKVRP